MYLRSLVEGEPQNIPPPCRSRVATQSSSPAIPFPSRFFKSRLLRVRIRFATRLLLLLAYRFIEFYSRLACHVTRDRAFESFESFYRVPSSSIVSHTSTNTSTIHRGFAATLSPSSRPPFSTLYDPREPSTDSSPLPLFPYGRVIGFH